MRSALTLAGIATGFLLAIVCLSGTREIDVEVDSWDLSDIEPGLRLNGRRVG